MSSIRLPSSRQLPRGGEDQRRIGTYIHVPRHEQLKRMVTGQTDGPFFQSDGFILCPFPRHLLKRPHQVIPSHHLARHLEILRIRFQPVVESIASKVAKVRKGDHGNVSVADRRNEDVGAIASLLEGPEHELERGLIRHPQSPSEHAEDIRSSTFPCRDLS